MTKISMIIVQSIIQVLLVHQSRKVPLADSHYKERMHLSFMVLCQQILKESQIRFNRNLTLIHNQLYNNSKQLFKFRKKSSKDKTQYLKQAIHRKKEMQIRKKEVEES
jgi:hypothetical protein